MAIELNMFDHQSFFISERTPEWMGGVIFVPREVA